MKIQEIWVVTSKSENTKKDKPTVGTFKTAGTLESSTDVVEGMVKFELEKTENDNENEFEKFLSKTNEVIKVVAENLSNSVENVENLSEMEIEFSLSFTEKLGIKIFEIGSQQSLKVKIKLQKNKK